MSGKLSNNSNHELILDSINEGVFTVNLDWRITSFNAAAQRITGVPREQALGRLCHEVFRASVCETNCSLKQTFASRKPIINSTAHIIDQKGRRVPIRLSTAILRDEAGGIAGGVETFQDLSHVAQLQKQLEARYSYEDIIGCSSSMLELFNILPQVAESSSTVLLEGASGTGKELFARAIHNLSPRCQQRFVGVNCAALPDTLLESELFGYMAGAFTDARRDKPGRFTIADGGTMFLDEIADMSPAMQVKLLRVLQERVIEPLGSLKPVPVDVRVIAATNRDLHEMVSNGSFREDLYYRIRVIHMKLPALKQRREDIPLLIDHMIYKYNHLQNKDIAGVSDEVMAILLNYEFPGNIRELENIIEQAFVLCRGGVIEIQHLPPELRSCSSSGLGGLGSLSLESMEKHLIMEALQRHQGKRKQAAHDLGIDVSTLYRKIKALNINIPEIKGRT
ncbi:MAG: sigma 54-interacting transcriptional regulator [Syntrophomonadaceae bacterium]|nr:sigma 54-interacting transcriptional regulator [Syntrophomonadaceae bacterium]